MKWQPIETCVIPPFNKELWFKDATPRCLLWGRNYATIGAYSYTERGKGRWQDLYGNLTPTHWMPLPEKPE